jgi:hypothetical protein
VELEMTFALSVASSEAHTWYQITKDFQSFGVGVFAVGAALIAFFSAQRVVRIQSRIARETTDRQFLLKLAREDEEETKRRLAFIIMLKARLSAIKLSIQHRIIYLESFQSAAQKNPDGYTYNFKATPVHWSIIADLKLLHEEARLSDIVWSDVSMLDSVNQLAFHYLNIIVQDCDAVLLPLKETAEHHGFVQIAEVDRAINIITQTQEPLASIEKQTDSAFETAKTDAANMNKNLRAASSKVA